MNGDGKHAISLRKYHSEYILKKKRKGKKRKKKEKKRTPLAQKKTATVEDQLNKDALSKMVEA